ncbi:MAG: hypothetical protein ACRCS3_12845, partial [Paracoccaceae bacterium]
MAWSDHWLCLRQSVTPSDMCKLNLTRIRFWLDIFSDTRIMLPMEKRPHTVVIGAGFGGLSAAIRLAA